MREEIDAEITAEQHHFKKISPDLERYLKNQNPKVQYEYQEIGLEMQKWFGKNIWWIFSRPEANLQKVRDALKICQQKGIKNIGYLIGILKTK
jgi:hypothetical protein